MLGAAACIGFNNPEGWAGPTVAADDLLVVSTDKGELSALKMEDFSRVWTFPTGQEEPEIDLEAIYTTPLLSGDTVYFAGYSGEVFALSLESGSEKWRFDTDDNIIAGLAISETTIYVGTDEGLLYALNLETELEEDNPNNPFDAGDSVWATPLLVEGVLYVASVNGKLYALDAETLEPIWDAPFKAGRGLISDPVLADGTILVGGIDRTLHAVDAASGEEREGWPFKADNWFWGKPLVLDGTVYAPNLDGNLYALSLETGDELWSFEAEDGIRSSPVLADDTLVLVDRDGNVYGLDPLTGEPLPWSPRAIDKTVLSNPLVLAEAIQEEMAEDVKEKVFISAEGGDLFRLEDPTTGDLSRLDLNTGSFVKVVTP